MKSRADIIKPILNGPKRQHFLPKFYLEGFTKDGMVAVFDRDLNQIRVQQPLNTCVIGHFYTFDDSEGRMGQITMPINILQYQVFFD